MAIIALNHMRTVSISDMCDVWLQSRMHLTQSARPLRIAAHGCSF